MSKKNKATETPATDAPVTLFQATAKGLAYAEKRRPFRKDGVTPAGEKGVQQDTASWSKVAEALANGPQPLGELVKAVGTHKSFVGYCVRRGWLAPVQAE
jgi:hypothetical protein